MEGLLFRLKDQREEPRHAGEGRFGLEGAAARPRVKTGHGPGSFPGPLNEKKGGKGHRVGQGALRTQDPQQQHQLGEKEWTLSEEWSLGLAAPPKER